jgi:2-oxoglutarate dehydrogenase E1 component
MALTSSSSSPSTQQGAQQASAAVNAWSPEYLEAEYTRFKAEPANLPSDLRAFFQGFDLALAGGNRPTAGVASPFQKAVDDLVHAYRDRGHLAARTDPLGRAPVRPEILQPAHHALTSADLDRDVETSVIPGRRSATLREIIEHLERVYCGSVGAEFTHIPDADEREWFLARLERAEGVAPITDADRAQILEHLTAGESLDRFLQKRYQGKKRFSIEGGESLIPLLKAMTQRAGELGTEEIILGMAHRGRLSVLKNYLGKDLTQVFTEFEDAWHAKDAIEGGDVKYHRGYSGDQRLDDGRLVHLSLLNNPSHLESVNPIVMGRCRAKQDRIGDREGRRIVSLLIHGDAAVAGQGIVAECLTMSQLDGYRVGGTLHVVINNLVGFTTDPTDARSTTYCTDIAKMVNCPVLHVNADDPEAVVRVARLAAEYRHEFHKDVFIDLVCYRRYGHNEQDEPTYTQPTLYALIKPDPGAPEHYRQRLIASGVVSAEHAQKLVDDEHNALDLAQSAARANPVNPVPAPGRGGWQGIQGQYCFEDPVTKVAPETIAEVCAALGRTPEGFGVNAKLRALLAARAALPQTRKLSHADAELLAIGTLLLDAKPVRLSGQDCRRGTFTQRHAVCRDERTGERYTPLNHIRPGQPARFDVWDSPLSEFGVMGFDYGYCRGAPQTLVMWEGQFGDFVNGAQVLIDQYLASSEIKWQRWGGLVLLLPHGYEGQGPEHSSARLERFLQLCANDNMEVVYPTTGAQTFHMLRRQMLRDFRKPLIVMTPKRFLRIETSTIDELSNGSFQHLIDDPARAATGATKLDPKKVKRVVYCSGKVYHELADRRAAGLAAGTGLNDVALVRVEQLYPLHTDLLKSIDGSYPASAQRVWVQEEPRNQGAFLYVADAFRELAGISLSYIGRVACASPAGGSEYAHKRIQDGILNQALGLAETPKAVAPSAAASAQPTAPSTPAPTKASATKPSSKPLSSAKPKGKR